MKIFYNRVSKNYLVMTLSLFISEIIFRVVSNVKVFEWSTLRIFLGISFVTLLFSLLFSFLPRFLNNLLCFLVAVFFTVYTFVQIGFLNFLGVYISFGTSSQAGAVKDYIGEFISSFKTKYYFILTPIIFLLFFYIFVDKKIKIMEKNDEIDYSDKFCKPSLKEQLAKDRKKAKLKDQFGDRIIAIISLAIIAGGYYYTLSANYMQNELQLVSNKKLFKSPSSPSIAINQFGTITYCLLDIKDLIIPQEETFYLEEYNKVEQIVNDYTRYIEDDSWIEVINNEKNKNYKTLSNYYISKPITDKNDYTGMFEGKNVIVIMMESATNIILDEQYYPNMAKLAKNGWSWSNSYSPRNSCNTGNNEMSGMSSLYTINNTCTANEYKDNKYPEAIFNLFNKMGYTTQSFHNYTDQYYYRRVIHPNMGSQKYWGVESLNIPYSNVYKEWPSDVDLMERILEKIEGEEKFMVWATSVTAHSPYIQSSTYGDKYLDLFKDTNYSISVKRYMSKLKEFDNAIGTLIDGLTEQGKLDDTVIVLFADHYPYAIDEEELNEYFSYDITVNNEIDRTPFIIYNPQITGTVYDKYTSYMNIVPTIANLFNLDYDPRLYAGYDILSPDYEDRVVFSDGSWQDKKAFYNVVTGKLTYVNPNDTYTVDEIKAINNSVKMRIDMSNLAIKTNYFNYIYDAIDKVEIQNKMKETEASGIEDPESEDEESEEDN